jgi:Cu(I)/Ag(I) efflux system membrane fusion protein
VGTVGLNERDISIVQARANGFVERVHPRAPGDVIPAGAPLAEVLHPTGWRAQREYLAVRATGRRGPGTGGPLAADAVGHAGRAHRARGASGQPQAVTTIVAPSARPDRRADGAAKA